MGAGDPSTVPSRARAAAARSRSIAVEVSSGQTPAARGLGRWLMGVAPPNARGLVSLAIVGDAKVRTLNRTYRGLDRATDVLSFPDRKMGSGKVFGRRSAKTLPDPIFLGDIVIARGVARRQARAAGHSERDELRVLALHGLLHLVGYDHEHDGGAMARLERRLRAKGGLGEALIEREARRQAGA